MESIQNENMISIKNEMELNINDMNIEEEIVKTSKKMKVFKHKIT
jgi:hypothetical protein